MSEMMLTLKRSSKGGRGDGGNTTNDISNGNNNSSTNSSGSVSGNSSNTGSSNNTSSGATPGSKSAKSSASSSPAPQAIAKVPPNLPVLKGGQRIHYPKLYQFRVDQGLHKNEDGLLTPAQLGLVYLDKCHHVSITNPTKDGPQSYRVRICKTCCNSDTHIELGTYIDQESAILVNDVHEILIGRFDKLIVLRPEDKNHLHKLYARKYDRHRGRDETNILALLGERNFGDDRKKRSRASKDGGGELDVFSDEVEANFSNFSYGDDISMIDSIGDDGKIFLFSENNNGKMNIFSEGGNQGLPFGTFSTFVPNNETGEVDNIANGGGGGGGVEGAQSQFYFGPNDLPEFGDNYLLGMPEFPSNEFPANSSGKRPFGDLFMEDGTIYENNNFYIPDDLNTNNRSRAGSHANGDLSMPPPSKKVPPALSTQLSNYDMALLSEVATRRSPMRALLRPRSQSFGGQSSEEYMALLNTPLTPMSTLRVFASMNDSDFIQAKAITEANKQGFNAPTSLLTRNDSIQQRPNNSMEIDNSRNNAISNQPPKVDLIRRTVSLSLPSKAEFTNNSNSINTTNNNMDVNSSSSSNNNSNSIDSNTSQNITSGNISDSSSMNTDLNSIIRTKSSNDLIASLTSLKTCFKDDEYTKFDGFPKTTRSTSTFNESDRSSQGFDNVDTSDGYVGGRSRSYSMPALMEGMSCIPGGRVKTDSNMQELKEMGYIGIYSPEERKIRIKKFLEKRKSRIWSQKVKYNVRKVFADSRTRVKGRFVKLDHGGRQSSTGSETSTSSTIDDSINPAPSSEKQ